MRRVHARTYARRTNVPVVPVLGFPCWMMMSGSSGGPLAIVEGASSVCVALRPRSRCVAMSSLARMSVRKVSLAMSGAPITRPFIP